jgi:hypothetical protein
VAVLLAVREPPHHPAGVDELTAATTRKGAVPDAGAHGSVGRAHGFARF